MNIEKFIKGKNESWFKDWFDTSFYHQLYANRNETEAAALVDALVAELNEQLRRTILPARYAIAFRQRPFSLCI